MWLGGRGWDVGKVGERSWGWDGEGDTGGSGDGCSVRPGAAAAPSSARGCDPWGRSGGGSVGGGSHRGVPVALPGAALTVGRWDGGGGAPTTPTEGNSGPPPNPTAALRPPRGPHGAPPRRPHRRLSSPRFPALLRERKGQKAPGTSYCSAGGAGAVPRPRGGGGGGGWGWERRGGAGRGAATARRASGNGPCAHGGARRYGRHRGGTPKGDTKEGDTKGGPIGVPPPKDPLFPPPRHSFPRKGTTTVPMALGSRPSPRPTAPHRSLRSRGVPTGL